jgi:hypothetical protein
MQREKSKMACITITVEESLKERLSRFPWVNWSEIGREEILKRYIFEKFIKTKKLSKEENDFCKRIDWHPVDEMPLRKEFIEEIKKIRKGKFKKYNSIDDLMKDTSK